VAAKQRSVSATWQGGYRCEVQAGEFTFTIDEPVEAGGTNQGPQPTEVLLASVASCFTLALSYAARKRELELTHLGVEATGIYDGPRFSAIEIAADVGCDPSEHERLISIAERVCYVTNTIKGTPPITISTINPRLTDLQPKSTIRNEHKG